MVHFVEQPEGEYSIFTTLALTTSLVRDAVEPQACLNLEKQLDRVAQCLRLTTTFSSRSVVARSAFSQLTRHWLSQLLLIGDSGMLWPSCITEYWK